MRPRNTALLKFSGVENGVGLRVVTSFTKRASFESLVPANTNHDRPSSILLSTCLAKDRSWKNLELRHDATSLSA